MARAAPRSPRGRRQAPTGTGTASPPHRPLRAPTATPRTGQVGPSTPKRPESRLPGQTPTTKAAAGQAPTKTPATQAPTTAPTSQSPTTALPAKPTYGQYGKSSSTTETIADRV